MDRRTLDHLKDRLLKRLVDGEIDKSLYDQVLLEIEKASEVAAPASDWETVVDDGATAIKGLCHSVARNFGLIDDEPASVSDRDEEKEKERLTYRLDRLSVLAIIHAVNAIIFGVLDIFGTGHGGFAFGVLSVIAGSVMLYTGYCMRTLQSYSFVWWSLFLFLTPIFGLWFLGVLVGIAGLFLLSGDKVERFFAEAPTGTGSLFRNVEGEKPKETSEERRERKRLQKYS